MKVEDKREKQENLQFGQLDQGCVFEYRVSGSNTWMGPCMKTELTTNTNAVYLRTGELGYISIDTQCRVLNATLVISTT